MRNAILTAMLAVLAVFFAGALQGGALAQTLPVKQAAFIAGGVGDDSAERMAAIGKEYNLKLLFAAKDGRYLADVAVSIKDDADRAVLVTTSEGPFLFVQLPPGKYRITTDYAGVVQARTTSVAASGRREMVFRWDEAAD